MTMGFEQFYPWTALSLVLSVVVFLSLWIRFCYLPFQVWKSNGIHGPLPSFFYGNYKSLDDVGLLKYLEQLHKDYGSNVGFYVGKIPQLSITELELIKLVSIKEFDSFMNRPLFPDIIGMKKEGLLMARDEAWRLARQALSPTFSPFKMKAMTPLIQSSVDTLVEVLQNNCDTGRSVEVFRLYGSFTMESLLATAFGRVIDVQRGQSDELTKAAGTIFGRTHEKKNTSILRLKMLLSNFPWLIYIIRFLVHLLQPEHLKAYRILQATASQLIQQRQNTPGKYQDFLQLMIEATVDDASSNKNRKLTVEEITAYAITFMMAGYETTANSLSYVSYLLALNPRVQEKLQEEIDKFYRENKEVSPYEASQDLQYLDMVMQESLRLYPPASLLLRECNKAYMYKDMTIPEGCSIMIPLYLLQKDPEYWEDPEKFDPSRFSAEAKAKRPQHCHMPFGSGPRNCIGMRFALLEAKMALIEILKRFTFVRAPDTQVPLETVLGIATSPKNGVHLRIVSR